MFFLVELVCVFVEGFWLKKIAIWEKIRYNNKQQKQNPLWRVFLKLHKKTVETTK